MPPLGSVFGVDWLNQNSLRKYPLSDDATCLDTTGTFTLPESLIVDLVLPIPGSSTKDPNGFHLSEVTVFGNGVVLAFAYTDPGAPSSPIEIGRLSVAKTHTPFTSYFLNGVGDFEGVVGKVVLGDLTDTLLHGGVFLFDKDSGRLVPTTIRPDIRGVSSLRVRNGGELSEPLFGDVEIVAGANVLLEVITSGGNNDIVINGINGTNFDADCACLENADRTVAPCIRTINGVTPSITGNFQISGASCITVSPGTSSLLLEDTCSKPCCTNTELQTVLASMNTLSADVRAQGFTQTQLETSLGQLQSLAASIAATGLLGG